MANLAEKSQWEDGIYQLETSDPVVGGPEGIDNLQPRQLANRTRYLKDQQEAHAAAPNPHPQYAKNDSPAFTGTPQTPQAPQFDNTTKVASTSFVQRALGNFANVQVVSGADTALNPSAYGCAIQIGGASCVITLPSGNSANAGSAILFYAQGAAGQTYTIKTQAGGFIYAPGAGYGTTNTSITLGTNDSVLLVNRSGAEWDVVDGSWILTNEAINFNGRQTSVTPVQFDSSAKLATTAFVQRALGGFQARKYITGTGVLANADSGSWIEAGGNGPSTITLPSPTGDNLVFRITNVTNNGATLTISTPSGYIVDQGASVSSINVDSRATVALASDGSNWIVLSHYSRSQTGQTASQFDSSTRLATTAFVQRALGSFAGFLGINASTTLSAAQAGFAIQSFGSGEITATLPAGADMQLGTCITFFNGSGSVFNIAAKSNDFIIGGTSRVQSVVLQKGDNLVLMSRGSNEWDIVGGSAALQYAQTAGATAPQFDNGAKLATTAFVQRALGNYAGFMSFTASTALTAANAGGIVNFYGGTAAQVITLPAASSVAAGAGFYFVNTGTVEVSVSRAGTDTFSLPGKTIASVALQPGDELFAYAANSGTQWVIGGSAARQFNATLGLTAPLGDNTQKVATMAAVAAAGMHFPQSSGIGIAANTVLTAGQINQWVEFSNANLTATLPLSSSVPYGSTFTFKVGYAGSKIAVQGNDKINTALSSVGTTYAPNVGETCTLVSNGGPGWYVVSSGVGGSGFLAGRVGTVSQGVPGGAMAVGETRANTLTFTAPCAGRVLAIASVTPATQQNVAVENRLSINGASVSDRTYGAQFDATAATATAGQVMTVQQQCIANDGGSPGQPFTMQLSYIFLPGQ